MNVQKRTTMGDFEFCLRVSLFTYIIQLSRVCLSHAVTVLVAPCGCIEYYQQLFITGQAYNLEKQGELNIPIDLDATLASMDTLEFCLVRENSMCHG